MVSHPHSNALFGLFIGCEGAKRTQIESEVQIHLKSP